MKVTAILLIAGQGQRFGSKTPKQFLNLSGKKIYLHTLETYLSFKEFFEILLVCNIDWIESVSKEIPNQRTRVIKGGATRQASIYQALLACNEKTSHVVVHDGVRPFVSKRIIKDNLQALTHHNAINTCIPSSDTIIQTKDSNTIKSIPNRSQYLRGQTPQSFSYPILLKAHQQASCYDSSDDCSLVLNINEPVYIVKGDEQNIKITNKLDLFLAEQLMRTRSILPNPSSYSLKNKAYAITGGTGGIGSALANLLKMEGAMPLIISKSSTTFSGDLTNFESTKRIFENIYKKYGPLHGLINCVGLLSLKPFQSLTSKEINYFISSNLHSLIYSCRCAYLQKKGHIINLSSSSFTRGRKSYTLYSAAKAAVVNFTQGLAEEHPELYINAIVPQRTDTLMRKKNFFYEDSSSLLSSETVAQEILRLLKQFEITGSIFEVKKT